MTIPTDSNCESGSSSAPVMPGALAKFGSAGVAGIAAISCGLAGCVCIVTGGAQGIGEACARRFALEKALVVIAPGLIATKLAAKGVLTSAAAKTRILRRTPLGRLGTPGKIATVAAFLASDTASYLTGEIIVADGGRMALNYTMESG